MTVNNHFAVLLATKGARDKKRISLAEVSRKTGIAERTLQSWARNDVTRYDASIISTLCAYFDCSVCDLLEYEPEAEPFPSGEGAAPPGQAGQASQLGKKPASDD